MPDGQDVTMTSLSKGSNIPLTAPALRAVLGWSAGAAVDVDASALLLTSSGKVRSDADFVFYNQPSDVTGAITHVGKQTAGTNLTDTVSVDTRRLDRDIERVIFAASADGGTFGQVPGLHLRLEDAGSGAELARFDILDATSETAFVFGELYLRNGAWKFRAVGQGYASGLAGLARDFGISVDDAPAVAVPPAAAPPAAALPAPSAPPTPSAPAAGVVNLDKGRVSLRKNQTVSLVKTGAPPLSKVVMGLGWDPAKHGRDIDLDASVISYDASGGKMGLVWFMHKSDYSGAIQHSGDNLTGQGGGDDEQIQVDLGALPAAVTHLVFTINSFTGQNFTEVRNAYCRLLDPTNTELVRYDLSAGEAQTGVLMARLSRTPDGTWTMRALGEFHKGRTVKAMTDPGSRAVLAG